ncbi:MAG TPA: hypothetical protein VHJ83_08355 [Micromonosporaceae bacterium]|nr:hypothetical protein [Micromonosporaceae bacterium]
MPRHRIAVLLLTNEGFYRVDGGVGRYLHNILDAGQVSDDVATKQGVTLDWHVAERTLGGRIDPAVLDRALDRYVRTGQVTFHPLVDPRRDAAETDHFEHFVALGAAVGQLVVQLAGTADSVLVIGGMSMFGMAPRYVLRAADQLGLPVSFVHLTHNPVITAHGGSDRPEAYSDAVTGHLARADERVCVGWESEWMRRQYASVHGIPDDKLLFARAGVPVDDPKFARQDPIRVQRILAELGVPLDRPLVVSWGRGGAGKGFTLLVEACHRIDDRLVPVVLNPLANQPLADLVTRIGSRAVLLSGQDDEVLTALCQWPGTVSASFLSWVEAASVTPIEAALMNGGRGMVVSAVPTGVYRELVVPGRNGVLAGERSVAAVAEMLNGLAELSEVERLVLSRHADEDARRNHDFVTNWRISLHGMLERHLRTIGRSAEQRREAQRKRFMYADGKVRFG